MGRPKSTGPSKQYPKASAFKTSSENDDGGHRLAFKERTSSFDASAALKLRPEESLDGPPPENGHASRHSIFESLYSNAPKKTLTIIDPQSNVPREALSKTEPDANPIGQSYGHPRIEPTLSPSAVQRLKKKTKQHQAKQTKNDPSDDDQNSLQNAETRVTKVASTTAEERAQRVRTVASDRMGVTLAEDLKPIAVEEEERAPRWLLIAAGVVAIGIVYVLLQLAASPKGMRPRYSNEDQKRMVLLHRFETGAELNGSRVSAEYDNLKTAPTLPADAVKQRPPSLMDGVPLAQENDLRTNARDRLEAADPNDPDRRVEYILQDEQAAAAWEQRAQHEYVKQFVKNVRDAGLQVRVQENLDVEVRRAPKPSGAGTPGSSSVSH